MTKTEVETIAPIATAPNRAQTVPFPKHRGDTQMNASILKFLRANGEQLDADISQALDIPMTQLKTLVAQLSASGDVICCKVTRFIEGRKIEGISCRLSCDLPAPARGRKPGVKKDPNADLKYPE